MGFPFRGADPNDDSQVENRGSSKRFLGWVSEIDWGAQLNALLTTPPSAGAASEAQAGVTQYGTAAEIAAGTLATKALSILQHARAALTSYEVPTGGPRSGLLTPLNFNVNGTDWNNYVASGLYVGSNMGNAPGNNSGWAWVIVQRLSDVWVGQIAHVFTTSSGSNAQVNEIWRRTLVSGTWTAWDRLIGDSNAPLLDRGGISASTSWNTLVTPGTYLFNGGAGNPPGFPQGAYNYGTLVVFRPAGQAVTQQYFPDGNRPYYWRTNFNGAATGPWSMTAGTAVNPT